MREKDHGVSENQIGGFYVTMIKAAPLLSDSKIGVVAPASPVSSLETIEDCITWCKARGWEVIPGRTVRPGKGDLSGTDIERRSDLEEMWLTPDIQAIWALRGGYGSMRLLPLLNYPLLAQNPKILVGFSDITALELAFWTKENLVSFHGPVLTTLKDEFSYKWAIRVLSGEITTEEFPWPEKIISAYRPIRAGKVEGRLLGGNLATLCAMIGTEYFPDLTGALFFTEEVGESPYRVDRMLTQLLLSGLLKNVAAILVGRSVPSPGQTEEELFRVFAERLRVLDCPSAYGFPIGHFGVQWTIPQGVKGEVNTGNGRLFLCENPVLRSKK